MTTIVLTVSQLPPDTAAKLVTELVDACSTFGLRVTAQIVPDPEPVCPVCRLPESEYAAVIEFEVFRRMKADR